MLLIVGLGNKGKEYEKTRHNAGFMFVDYLTLKLGQVFTFDKYSDSEILRGTLNKKELILAKPQTFMNDSGRAVRALTMHYNLQPSTIYIVHDDLDLRLGEYKIQKGKGPKIHNGILSVEEYLKTKDFWRVRIGVDNRTTGNRIDGYNYVLQNFRPEELKTLTDTFPSLLEQVVIDVNRKS